MTVRLRGHHLLCLLGYRGMGYSPAFCDNMSAIYERLRSKPETVIAIVDGPDDICRHYPEERQPHCMAATVFEKDGLVLEAAGVAPGSTLTWEEAYEHISRHVRPDHIDRICVGCPWQSYGVCKEGVARAAAGHPLPPLPG